MNKNILTIAFLCSISYSAFGGDIRVAKEISQIDQQKLKQMTDEIYNHIRELKPQERKAFQSDADFIREQWKNEGRYPDMRISEKITLAQYTVLNRVKNLNRVTPHTEKAAVKANSSNLSEVQSVASVDKHAVASAGSSSVESLPANNAKQISLDKQYLILETYKTQLHPNDKKRFESSAKKIREEWQNRSDRRADLDRQAQIILSEYELMEKEGKEINSKASAGGGESLPFNHVGAQNQKAEDVKSAESKDLFDLKKAAVPYNAKQPATTASALAVASVVKIDYEPAAQQLLALIKNLEQDVDKYNKQWTSLGYTELKNRWNDLNFTMIGLRDKPGVGAVVNQCNDILINLKIKLKL